MGLRAGDLDRRIVLQRYEMTRGPKNEPVESWVPMPKVWAAWRRASAREVLAAAEVKAVVTDIFEIRWSSVVADVDAKFRLVYQAQTYDIEAIAEIDRRVGLRISASRPADGGSL